MTLPAYLSAFLSLPTLGLALFCWPRRHLAVAPPLAPLCLGLALLLIFNALFLLAAEISDPTLAVAKMLFWAGWFTIAMTAVSCSTLWLVMSWRPLPWPAGWQRLLAAGLVLLWLILSYQRLFRLELLAGSIDYDPLSHLLLFQLTVPGKCWAFFWTLIQLASLSRLLLNWIQSPSPSQRQQARWLLLSLSISLLLLSFFFLPALLYLTPWLLASMPFLIAWAFFRTGLLGLPALLSEHRFSTDADGWTGFGSTATDSGSQPSSRTTVPSPVRSGRGATLVPDLFSVLLTG